MTFDEFITELLRNPHVKTCVGEDGGIVYKMHEIFYDQHLMGKFSDDEFIFYKFVKLKHNKWHSGYSKIVWFKTEYKNYDVCLIPTLIQEFVKSVEEKKLAEKKITAIRMEHEIQKDFV